MIWRIKSINKCDMVAVEEWSEVVCFLIYVDY